MLRKKKKLLITQSLPSPPAVRTDTSSPICFLKYPIQLISNVPSSTSSLNPRILPNSSMNRLSSPQPHLGCIP
ncbi:hypothetical protein I7I48_07294 [Histoplasma ohiense]|nr:hypothetical protein I7I48_07294 [Histoplasma ohiense (nom. inval.)]